MANNLTRRLFLKLFGAAPAVALAANVEPAKAEPVAGKVRETFGSGLATYERRGQDVFVTSYVNQAPPMGRLPDGLYNLVAKAPIRIGQTVTRDDDGLVRPCTVVDEPIGVCLATYRRTATIRIGR